MVVGGRGGVELGQVKLDEKQMIYQILLHKKIFRKTVSSNYDSGGREYSFVSSCCSGLALFPCVLKTQPKHGGESNHAMICFL